MSRRLFWSAFVIDKLQAFYHGRPASIQEADTLVPLIFHDQFEEMESWYPLQPAPLDVGLFAPMHSVSNFLQLAKLAIIMNKILNKIYREKSETQSPHAMLKNLKSLDEELQVWYSTLPVHLHQDLSPQMIGNDPSSLPSPHVYTLLYVK